MIILVFIFHDINDVCFETDDVITVIVDDIILDS